jgi:hypothetical protein
MKTHNFKVTKPPKETKPEINQDKNTLTIPWAAIGFTIMLIGLVAYGSFRSVATYKSWSATWDVVTFAHNNPEFVRNMKTGYETKIESVKKEMITGVVQPVADATPVATLSGSLKTKSVK